MQQLLQLRGNVIVEFDRNGRLCPGQAIGESDPHSPVRQRRGLLMAADRNEQDQLSVAVRRATANPGEIALAPLTGPDGRRHVLQVHPVPRNGRDIFLSAAAIAVLIEFDRSVDKGSINARSLHDIFGLSDREAAVARLLSEGSDLSAVAETLEIGHETARSYLKRVFDKTGVRRQTELVALLGRITP